MYLFISIHESLITQKAFKYLKQFLGNYRFICLQELYQPSLLFSVSIFHVLN